ncbi:hypothetical protein HYC85_020705 [Camellia sinensis]|uniref:Uncharacterized protein n=1 Tax=Camellia sinensis TaxID=4442 RepID=A0A7J7GQJ3_CAMSI|nr:hypothetical protein HYC85_020705 [Camellia sinensis]
MGALAAQETFPLHRDSQSLSFLLPLGFAIGAFIPAIFALYFARRGSLYVHLYNQPKNN